VSCHLHAPSTSCAPAAASDVSKGSLKRKLYTKTAGHSEWVTCCTYTPSGERSSFAKNTVADSGISHIIFCISILQIRAHSACLQAPLSPEGWTHACGYGHQEV
jgi:hypothetical protein